MGSEQRGPSNANTFVIRPNAAPSWRQIRIFFILVASVSLTVAGGFALLGFWPILPFAGLELLLLAWALYTTARRAERREVVRVNEDTVEVERGIRQPEQSWTLQKAWAQVRVVLLNVQNAAEGGGMRRMEWSDPHEKRKPARQQAAAVSAWRGRLGGCAGGVV